MALTVFPNASGTAATHGWLELDTVLARKTTDPVVGTECLEPGSFTFGAWGAPTPTLPMPDPAPVAEPAPAAAWGPAPEMPAAGPSAIPAAPLTVTIAGTGRGTIASSAAGAICTGVEVTCTTLVPDGQTVTLTATPVAGHAFAGWGGACTGTQPCTVFINGPQTVVATFNAAATLSYYHTDVLGSVRAITDAVGGVLARQDYFPFGESTAPLTGDPRRFTGKARDAETALDYFDARYYRNVWGRFTTADPFVNQAKTKVNPQRWNRYTYALNSPVVFVDPRGLDAFYFDRTGRELITRRVDEPWWKDMFGDQYFLVDDEGTAHLLEGPLAPLPSGQKYVVLSQEQATAELRQFLDQFARLPGQGAASLSEVMEKSPPGRDWDFKATHGGMLFTLGGKLRNADFVGNVAWGYIMASNNWPEGVAHLGAGYAQVRFNPKAVGICGGDTCRDYQAVASGYRAFYADLFLSLIAGR